MSSILSIYLDGTVVQILKAKIANSSITVKEALTFPHDELESYLLGCRHNNFIISCNPSSFYQDIIFLPKAAVKLYDNLIRAEMSKAHPDLAGFTFNYGVIGETTLDGVVQNKIAVLSYADEATAAFISLFYSNKKIIANLYATPYTIFRLAVSACESDSGQARIFITPLPGEKLILLCEKNELEFVRKIPSPETVLLPADVQNINMTMDYCFQSLRVRVAEAVMLNTPETSDDLPPPFNAPFRSLLPVELAGLPEQTVRNFMAPIATALHHVKDKGKNDILPSEYVSFKLHRNIFTSAILINIFISLLMGWLAFSEYNATTKHKEKIKSFRARLASASDEIAAYKKLDDEIKALESPMAFLNKLNTSQHPGTALASLKPPETKNYFFKGITLKNAEGVVNVHFEGAITASGYKETQTVFEGVVEQLKKIPGYSVSSSIIDIKQKTFIIEALYKGARQQSK